jgi:ribosomal-protein-alanine N-acetyltransferase
MPSPGAPSSVPLEHSPAAALVWDSQPAPEELAALDAECFEPALSAAVYLHWLKFPYLRCWVLRSGERAEARARAEAPALAWAVCQRIEQEAEVLRLGVRPDLRRRGWGRVLLLGVLERLRAEGARRIYLEVRAGNDAAQSLYRAAGFRETGRRRGYYTNPPEDAVLMAWESGSRP